MINEVYEFKKEIKLSINKDKLTDLINGIKEYHKSNIVDISIQDKNKIYVKFNRKLKHNVWDNYKLFDNIIKKWTDNTEVPVYLLYDLYVISSNECIIEF